MSSIETPTTLADALLAQRDAILETKKLFEICATDDRDEQHMLLGNYFFLTSKGAVSKEEYLAVLKRCADSGDYHELCMMFSQHYMAHLRSGTMDSNTKADIAFTNGQSRGIEGYHAAQGKNLLAHVGSPGLQDLPDWMIAIDQSGMSLSDIYSLLEGGHLQKMTSRTDAVVDGVIENTRSQLA